MKKISVILVILIIFNFICQNLFVLNVYAISEPNTSDISETKGAYSSFSMDEYKSISDEGKVTINGNSRDIKLGESDIGSASSLVGTFFVNIASIASRVASNITNKGGLYYTESDYSAQNTGLFTINSLIFGEYLIFNPKVYEKSTDLNPDIKPSMITSSIDTIKESGASLSKVFMYIGIALSMPFILLSIVRAANATKASDLAAWKKILARWVLCLFLMIFFHYILIAIDLVADSFINTFWNIRVSLEQGGYEAFEVKVEEEIAKQYTNTGGVISLAYAVIFVGIIVLQMSFLVKYAIRTLGIIFLFIIAPLVILVHSINLMLGKESDVLGDFFKDYILLVFMQPLHALFYLIFFFSVSAIAIKVPVLGILLLFALLRATDIAKAMFGWELGSSLFTRKQ